MWKQKAAQVIPTVISSTGVIPKSLPQSLTTLNLHPNTYIQLQKSVILGTCSIVRKFFKLQIRPPSLILLIITSQDRWIFPSQRWEVRNSIIIILSTLFRLFTIMYLKQTMFIGYIVLQLFWNYNLCYVYFAREIYFYILQSVWWSEDGHTDCNTAIPRLTSDPANEFFG